MGKVKLLIGRRKLSIPRSVISRVWDEILSMPDSEFDLETPRTVIVKNRPPKKIELPKKIKSKQTAAKKSKPKKSTRR